MNSEFADVVEKVKRLSPEEKQELKFLLDRYLIESRREEIYGNYKQSEREAGEAKLKFSGDLKKLKKMIKE